MTPTTLYDIAFKCRRRCRTTYPHIDDNRRKDTKCHKRCRTRLPHVVDDSPSASQISSTMSCEIVSCRRRPSGGPPKVCHSTLPSSFRLPHPVTIYRWMGGVGIWGCDGHVCRYVLESGRPHMDAPQLQNYVQRCGSHFGPMGEPISVHNPYPGPGAPSYCV